MTIAAGVGLSTGTDSAQAARLALERAGVDPGQGALAIGATIEEGQLVLVSEGAA